MKIHLVLSYSVPSLNRSMGQHWSHHYKERKKAIRALLSALLATACDPVIQIISPEVAKLCSTAYGTLGLYQATSRGGSTSKSARSKSARGASKEPKSPL